MVPLLTDEECIDAATEAVAPLQEFVDRYDDLSVEEWNALDPPPDVEAAQNAVVAIAQAAVDRGCFPATMEERIAAEIDQIDGQSEVGRAIAAALRGDGPFLGPPAPVVESTVPRNSVPTTVTLEPGESLPDLLLRLAPGSTVRFAAGEHRFTEPIVIDMDLHFEGVGVEESLLTSTAEGVALAFVGPGGFTMRDLTLEHAGEKEASVFLAIEGPVTIEDARLRGGVAGTAADGGGHGLVFAYENLPGFPEREEYQRSGPLTVRRTTIEGNAAAGMLVTGSAAPDLDAVAVRSNGGCGLCYSGEASGTVTDGTIEANEIGLQIGDDARVTVTGSRITQSVSVGVTIDGGAVLDVSESSIEENGAIGVQATGEAAASLDRTTIRKHGVGVLNAGAAQLTITDSGVVDHEIGIQAGGTSDVRVDDSVIWLSSVAALSFGEQSTGTATANEIDQAADVGIQVVDEATAELTENVIENAGAVGISFVGQSTGSATANRLTGREVGIQVGGASAPTLRSNVVIDSVAVGILFGDESVGSAETNEVTSAEAVGLLVGGTSAPVITANQLVGNGVGLVFRESALGLATGNVIDRQAIGIQVVDSARPAIDGNTVTNSLEAGVVYGGTSGGTFVRNTLRENGNVTLQVGDAATPTVTENELRGAGVYGTIFQDNGGGEYRANRVINYVFGVQLNGSAAPRLYDNTFEEIALTNMVYADTSGGENSGNTCTESFSAGISITAPADPNVGDNDCTVSRG